MDIERKIELIKRPPTEEIISVEDLRELFENKEHPIAYNGFEPSGPMHLGTGLISAYKMKDFIEAGIHYKVLLADWHAFLNKKMGGSMEKIKKVAEYFKAGWAALGVKNIDYIYAEELTSRKSYWETVMKISTKTTLNRIKRCLPILGRSEKEGLTFAQLLYPTLQCADIFELKVDINQLGMDQRNVNMLARDIGPKLGFWKPVAVHHHLLMGLIKQERMGYDVDVNIDAQISSKQSKSKPDSAIFITDTPDEIRRKIKKAYCPEKDLDENPIYEIIKYIILREKNSTFKIERKEKFGGDILVDLEEFKKLYKSGELHPLDVKKNVASKLIDILEPARKYFKKNKDILKVFKESKVTR
ncbi:MAG: tyrosine--tRNA ligase [Candidatus Lokiarchaeota archaeon]|nr:tyrosine--tRNA ligase [Candidatus Lokiarchaeota archaeon]